jgi:hypothetical protein
MKEFIPYEQAIELKELGFDEPCFKYWVQTYNDTHVWMDVHDKALNDDDCKAPLYQQAFRWFREKYKFNHSIIFHKHPFGTDDYQYLILLDEDEFVETGFNTYEEAELVCLKKLIEIVKEKISYEN